MGHPHPLHASPFRPGLLSRQIHEEGNRPLSLSASLNRHARPPPACTIQWDPRELVFLGRGEGPWTLAWGNGDWGPPDSGDLKLSEL
ncbi:MAG: DUF3999 domain-containing protein, partial [Treponema sp.]|nr:DUF3999 domain-containing protein [Treponema sp.]